jgi:hypothetical protein
MEPTRTNRGDDRLTGNRPARTCAAARFLHFIFAADTRSSVYFWYARHCAPF